MNAKNKSTRAPGRFKLRLQNRITATLLVLFLLYSFLFLPDDLLAELRTTIGIVGELTAKVLGTFACVSIVRWILFTQDSLATGRGRYSVWFREQFPDQLIMSEYSCDKPKATTLWFQWFNRWEDGPSPYSDYHRITFSRSYGCRLIFMLRQWLLAFAIVGSATLLAVLLLRAPFSRWFLCCWVVALTLLIYLYLGVANRIPKSSDGNSSGCWLKFKEISDIQKTLMKQDVFHRCPTFEEAWQWVAGWPPGSTQSVPVERRE